MNKGRTEGYLDALVVPVKDGVIPIADAAKRANMTETEFIEKTGLKA